MSRISRPRAADPVSPGRIPGSDTSRRQEWAAKSPKEVLSRYQPGRADPMKVLDVLITLFNTRHTAREKTVSHKTRHERARFLRQFFRDLQRKAGFRTPPDPRNLGQKHVHAMVLVWKREQLAPATIQTYLSFLRGLASWLDKPGFVRAPAHYGLSLEEYERHEYAERDKSWAAQGVDVEAKLAEVAVFDPRVAASLRLMHTLALRRKESVMFRPYEHVVPFEQTGLSPDKRKADEYVWVKGKGGRVRWVALETPEQRSAVALARSLVTGRDAHMGHPAHSLERNLRRLDYALEKFGITRRQAGVTGHGLRHGNLNDFYESLSGNPSPVRGGGIVPVDVDHAARLAVAERAGHSRMRASGAYIGAVLPRSILNRSEK
ncbi:phage integrase N-terminal domain-containing protein [Burkholderia vietnamiensis]|uniref:phage integrase N-terminal domain-containing protein n=1 Tax=Burkholderia vietnamiensis TaxID=60552 RepID=UPI001D13EEBB|nr:phage integrase N-terminal domain-containing protein [Burkholderia vietnamiensis]